MNKLKRASYGFIIYAPVSLWQIKVKLKNIISCFLFIFLSVPIFGKGLTDTTIQPAAAYPDKFLGDLKGLRVGLIINQTSESNGKSLLDVLISRGIRVTKIFVPEHGFRGNEDAGAHIANGIDSATKLPVISLYGANKKPTSAQLDDVDIMIYDLQDVGVRFYTYISTLQYCMEAAANTGKRFMVLDRPNPNGFYVDGPVLEKKHSSFVGMQPIPVVYGMTAGEYARMLVGEGWFAGAASLQLTVVPCRNYTHSRKYILPVPPSPNLRTMDAIYAYPSLCLFEGTPVSVGRGTDKPFMQFGCPEFRGSYSYSFVPRSGYGAKKPPFEDKECFGKVVTKMGFTNQMQLDWLLDAYKAHPQKDKFFTPFFTKLSGTNNLEAQIRDLKNAASIRQSWKKDIIRFKKIRKKYLLYPDFE
jgi:uncharacterized protein YbbC (DUF1343 family)